MNHTAVIKANTHAMLKRKQKDASLTVNVWATERASTLVTCNMALAMVFLSALVI